MGRERSGFHRGTCHRSGGYCATNDIIGTDIVKPTAIILVGIDVKANGNVLTHLNIKLLDTVLTKDTEQTLTRILARNLNNIVL